ncbi:MAG: F0F1 ATP synthase subunit A [Fuerstiella sp.]|nr:F0F1 ATP synthase subunit A [Fuerstiella sp.]MCP4784558.1 F0F1 ATP synthase subunit A [Fuerstiella sp.]MCP4854991.1 F0F1 ATP synthase subunit A [Fuerstiella sp.]
MSAEHDVDHFHHVRDAPGFDIPGGMADAHGHGTLDIFLPRIFDWELKINDYVLTDWQLTKFMALQVVAAVFVFVVFRGLAKRIQNGKPAKGRFWNFWEAIALFIRDEVVRPTIGDHHHDDDGHGHQQGGHPADQYLPFIWSCFFYILVCNLLGAVPWMGSATGNINVTGVLAISAFVATVVFGFRAMGPGGFFGNMEPDTGVPGAFGLLLSKGIFGIEVFGFFIKHGVLAVRLFANIMGGHTVVAVILGFIAQAAHSSLPLWGLVTFGSIVGQIFIGLLELFVSFLQAYVFAFLATIFIAGAVHEH